MAISTAYESRASNGENGDENAPEPAISCQAGCGACCRQFVTVSPAEAIMTREIVEGLPSAKRAMWQMNQAALIDRLHDNDIWGRCECLMRGEEIDEADHYDLARAWFELSIPCPALEDEFCSIHAVRPSPCREYLVTSLAEHCRDPFQQHVERVTTTAPVSHALSAMCAHLLKTEFIQIPLPLSLWWAEWHEDIQALRWDEAYLVDLFVRYLEIYSGQ